MAIAKETKVGLLVIAALGGLGWLSVQSGVLGGALSQPTRDLASTFTDVEGISVGSSVKMAGVPVGEVTQIDLKPNSTAVVHYKVKKDIPLPVDVTAQITTSGLIGERFLALMPGSSSLSSGTTALLPPPADNATTAIPASGGPGSGGAGALGSFGKVGEDLQAMTGTLRQVLASPENAEKLQRIIDGLASFADNVGGLQSLNNPNSPLGTLLKNDNGQTKQTLDDLHTAMNNFNQVMSKVNTGQGTIGRLINDPQTADKIDNALDTLGAVGERVDQFRTDVDFQGYSLVGEKGIGKGVATLTLQPRPTRFYVVGVTSDGFASKERAYSDPTNPYFHKDFGARTKLTAQFGHVFQNAVFGQDVAVRAGLKDSTGGVGVDYSIPTGVSAIGNIALSSDVYDFGGSNTPGSDSAHWDVKAKVNLWNNMLYGIAGYDNILNQEYGSPIIGLGVHFQDDDLKYIVGKAL